MSDYTFRLYTSRNSVGGGYFRVAELWCGDRCDLRKVYDGTFLTRLANRRALAMVREWRDIYDAKPRCER